MKIIIKICNAFLIVVFCLSSNIYASYRKGHLIVKLKDVKDIRNAFSILNNRYKIQKQFQNHAYLISLKDKSESNLFDIKDKLEMDKRIQYVELDYVVNSSNIIPNDPLILEQYALKVMYLKDAWSITTGSKKIIVAVLDTGIKYSHPDISLNIWNNPHESGFDINGREKKSNGIDDDNNGYIDDFMGWNFFGNDNDPDDDSYNGHGTHVAGIIGARGNNYLGISGINWNISLMPIKFLNSRGSGHISDAALALEYAIKNGADISNMSFGTFEYSQTLYEMLKIAEDKGHLVAAAAGNQPRNTDLYAYYPSNYCLSNIISVAATNASMELASFSTWGKMYVDIAAPGSEILSLSNWQNRYRLLSGTSMAAPQISGILALIKSKYPHLDYLEIKHRLLNGGTLLDSLTGKVSTGAIANAEKSLEIDLISPNKVDLISIVRSVPTSIEVEFLESGDDGSSGIASNYFGLISSTKKDNYKKTSFSYKKSNGKLRGKFIGLPLNQSFFLKIIAIDNVGNIGETSDVLQIDSQNVDILYENDGSNMNGIEADNPWGIEIRNSESWFSDSPYFAYENYVESSIIFPEIKVSKKRIWLSFQAHHCLDAKDQFGDYLYVEFLSMKGRWLNIAKIVGLKKATYYNIEIPKEIGQKKIKFRFRMSSDFADNRDGVLINKIILYQIK